MHALQLQILIRGIELCRVGGTVVYSTCSLRSETAAIEGGAVLALL